MSQEMMGIGTYIDKKRRKEDEEERNRDDIPFEGEKKCCLLKDISKIEENNLKENSYNLCTAGFVAWIGLVQYKLFNYEAVVLAAPLHNECSPTSLSSASSSSTKKIVPFSAISVPSCSSTHFTTASAFLLILFEIPIMDNPFCEAIRIGNVIVCECLQYTGQNFCIEMPVTFATERTIFLLNTEDLEMGSTVNNLNVMIADPFKYLTQCSLPISTMIFMNNGYRISTGKATQKQVKKKGRLSIVHEMNQIGSDIPIKLKHNVKTFQPFKPVLSDANKKERVKSVQTPLKNNVNAQQRSKHSLLKLREKGYDKKLFKQRSPANVQRKVKADEPLRASSSRLDEKKSLRNVDKNFSDHFKNSRSFKSAISKRGTSNNKNIIQESVKDVPALVNQKNYAYQIFRHSLGKKDDEKDNTEELEQVLFFNAKHFLPRRDEREHKKQLEEGVFDNLEVSQPGASLPCKEEKNIKLRNAAQAASVPANQKVNAYKTAKHSLPKQSAKDSRQVLELQFSDNVFESNVKGYQPFSSSSLRVNNKANIRQQEKDIIANRDDFQQSRPGCSKDSANENKCKDEDKVSAYLKKNANACRLFQSIFEEFDENKD